MGKETIRLVVPTEHGGEATEIMADRAFHRGAIPGHLIGPRSKTIKHRNGYFGSRTSMAAPA